MSFCAQGVVLLFVVSAAVTKQCGARLHFFVVGGAVCVRVWGGVADISNCTEPQNANYGAFLHSDNVAIVTLATGPECSALSP